MPLAEISNIYWDGYGLSHPHSGIFRYAYHLAASLNFYDCRPKMVLSQVGLKYWKGYECAEISSKILPDKIASTKLAWCYLISRFFDQMPKVRRGIVHGLSNFNLPFLAKKKWPCVLTMHDLIPLLKDSKVSNVSKLQIEYCLPKALHYADVIICISKWTEQLLHQFYPFVSQKTVVVPNGVAKNFDGNLKQDLDLGVSILSISRWEPYKRLNLIIDILKLRKKFKATVVTNQMGKTILERMGKELIAENRLKLLTNVPDQDMRRLYANSNVYLHPSLYEGYCLPASEALVMGVPVIYCSGSGIDEVCGNKLCIGLSSDARVDDWVSAVELSSQWKYSEIFKINHQSIIEKMPTWDDNAKAVLSLYNKINN